jgi:hypothetical protein
VSKTWSPRINKKKKGRKTHIKKNSQSVEANPVPKFRVLTSPPSSPSPTQSTEPLQRKSLKLIKLLSKNKIELVLILVIEDEYLQIPG